MLVVNQILYALVTSDEVIKAESSFVHLTVESVILKWSTPGLDEKRTVSVCDVENDGKWDYLSEGRMYFTIAEGATIVPADASGYGIGNTSFAQPKVIQVTKNAKQSDFTADALE